MNLFVRLFIILLVILPTACNKKQELVDPIKDTSLDYESASDLVDGYNSDH